MSELSLTSLGTKRVAGIQIVVGRQRNVEYSSSGSLRRRE